MESLRRLPAGGTVVILCVLGAASLTGCGAWSLDRFAAAHADSARRHAERAAMLAQDGRKDPAFREHDAALNSLDRALALSDSPETQANLLAIRYQVESGFGDAKAAKLSLSRIGRVAPDSVEFAMFEAHEMARGGDLESARRTIENGLRFHPTAEDLLWADGMLCLELDDVEGAVGVFERLELAGRIHGTDWELNGRFGLGLAIGMIRGDDPRAAAGLRSAIETSLPNTELIVDEVGMRSAKLEKALRTVAGQASRAHPDDALLGYLHAYIERAAGFPQACVDVIDRLLATEGRPNEADLEWLACTAQFDLEQPEAAIARTRTLLEKTPWHTGALPVFVQAAMATPDGSPQRADAVRFIAGAREHYTKERRERLADAPRDERQRQAATFEFDRILAFLDEMDRALARGP